VKLSAKKLVRLLLDGLQVGANNGLLVKTTALKSPVSKFTSMLTCLLLMEYFDGGFGRF
jgi:hypothetical protein